MSMHTRILSALGLASSVLAGCSGTSNSVETPITKNPATASSAASSALSASVASPRSERGDAKPPIEGLADYKRAARPLPALNILRPGKKKPAKAPGLRAQASAEYTKLDVTYTATKVGDRPAFVRTYNGLLVGPVLRARPGETLNIELTNSLPKDPDDTSTGAHGHGHAHAAGGGNINTPHGFNVTNLHVHGLHVRPDYPARCDAIPPKDRAEKCPAVADNVLISVDPGKSQRYEIEIPSDHPAGTHWYHAHKHGSVAMQLASGMAGPIIIEGGLDDLPELKRAEEKIIVFQQLILSSCGPKAVENGNVGGGKDCRSGDPQNFVQYESCTEYFQRLGISAYPKDALCVENFNVSFGPGKWAGSMVPNFGDRTSLNGEIVPTITTQKGRLLRYRLIDGGIRESIQLAVVAFDKLETQNVDDPMNDPNAIANRLELGAIAYDGIATGRLDQLKVVELEPGYRADLLSRIDQPGDYVLIDLATLPARSLNAVAEPLEILARLHVEDSTAPPDAFPTAEALAKLVPYKPVQDSEVKGCQYNAFNIDTSGATVLFEVNGKPYDPAAAPRTATLDTADEWVVTSGLANHPFHIHVNPFEIVDGYGPFPKGTWKDTLLVFGPANKEPAKPFRIRTRYEDFTGTFVLHCHILDHEDQGMMQDVEVIPKGSKSSACPTLCSGPGCGAMCEVKEPPMDGKCPPASSAANGNR